MRWMRARRSNICTGCIGVIQENEDYYGNSSSAFCKECGVKKQQQEIGYSREKKSYTEIKNKETCDFCKQPSVGHLMGKAVCQDHIGDAMLK
jgi:hypothetical protein